MSVNLNIKSSTRNNFSVSVDLDITVERFKEIIAEKSGIPVNQQRLIHSGHVLKDAQTLASYSIKDGNNVHLVQGQAQPQQNNQPQPTINPLPQQNQPNLSSSNPFANLYGNSVGMGNNMQQMQQQLMNNPNMMREMMNNPIMQSILNDPETMRSIMMSNPQMREVLERNPEIGHILNDPQVLRQTMEMARNPELFREMMRNTDRAMSNIESHPQGFNALRRLYSEVSEPLMEAAIGGNSPTSSNDNMANQPPSSTPNTDPLPNPWGSNPAPSAASSTNPANAGNTNAQGFANPFANPFAAFGGMGNGGTNTATGADGGNAANPFAGMGGMGNMFGGMDPMGGMDPNTMAQMMQNPMVQNMMQQMFQNPEMMRMMINSNPMLRQMTESNPMLMQLFENPQFMQMMMNPQTLQSLGSMGGMGGFGNNAGTGGLFGASAQSQPQNTTPNTASATGASSTNTNNVPPANPFASLFGMNNNPSSSATGNTQQQPNFADMMNMFGGFGGGMGGFGGNNAQASSENLPPPRERFSVQLQQLQDMGFDNEAVNIRALEATRGNVQAAVDRILNGL